MVTASSSQLATAFSGPPGFAGQLHGNEVVLGVEIILAGLIDHPQVPFVRGHGVRQLLVELAQLEIIASLVSNAEEKAPLPPCRRHQSRNRLIFMFTRPTP